MGCSSCVVFFRPFIGSSDKSAAEDDELNDLYREKRSVSQDQNPPLVIHNDTIQPIRDLYETAVVYGKQSLVLTNLNHFQEYSIEV